MSANEGEDKKTINKFITFFLVDIIYIIGSYINEWFIRIKNQVNYT